MSDLSALETSRIYSRHMQMSYVVLFAVAVFTGTVLRIALLPVYPLVVVLIAAVYHFRLSAALLALLTLTVLSLVVSFRFEAIKYNLVSLFHFIPFLLLLFCNPARESERSPDNLKILITALSLVVFTNDAIGFVQIAANPTSDDSFVGLYSEYSLSINGLMLLNAIIFFFYFLKLIYYGRTKFGLLSVFFLISAVLGFYGAGLMACLAAFVLSFFSFQFAALIKTTAVTIVSIFTIYFLMLWIKPDTLEYNVSNLRKLASFDPNAGPRKVKAFYNYIEAYPANIKDFLLGSGPGTFNSRSAFMVGSPSYFSKATFIKDDFQPYYFRKYAYSLWNDSNTSKALYMDGFRNQPFSSILALLGEFGLIFTAAFFFFYLRYYRQLSRLYHQLEKSSEREVYFRFAKCLMILLPLLLLIDNYFEYPEIMIPMLLGIKFSHAGMLALRKKQVHGY